jgi:hypothetical protein
MIEPALNCKEHLFALSQNIKAVICLPFPVICIVYADVRVKAIFIAGIANHLLRSITFQLSLYYALTFIHT